MLVTGHNSVGLSRPALLLVRKQATEVGVDVVSGNVEPKGEQGYMRSLDAENAQHDLLSLPHVHVLVRQGTEVSKVHKGLPAVGRGHGGWVVQVVGGGDLERDDAFCLSVVVVAADTIVARLVRAALLMWAKERVPSLPGRPSCRAHSEHRGKSVGNVICVQIKDRCYENGFVHIK